MQAIFDGLKVLDLSNVLSGPTLTRLMTEMGAEVIKVELHPAGDIGRYLPWLRNGRSGYHVQQNRGKKSLFVDGKHPEGRELLLDLVEQVDVLVENFAPGAVGRLGLGWDVVSARNPRLVMCSISAFGQTGPLAQLPGYDPIAQAYTGTMHMVGERTGSPAMMAFSPGDVLTGVHGLAGVCAALYHRERTGQGQKVEVSLVDSYVTCHEINFQVTSASEGEFHPQRNGSVHPLIGGCGAFPVRDGHVAMAVLNDRQWAGLCAAMGDPGLVDDPRFASTEGRTANADAFNQLIRDWLMTQPGRDDVVETPRRRAGAGGAGAVGRGGAGEPAPAPEPHAAHRARRAARPGGRAGHAHPLLRVPRRAGPRRRVAGCAQRGGRARPVGQGRRDLRAARRPWRAALRTRQLSSAEQAGSSPWRGRAGAHRAARRGGDCAFRDPAGNLIRIQELR